MGAPIRGSVSDYAGRLVVSDAAVHDLLLEGAEEALDHPVRFRFADEGVARGDAPEADLSLEVVGQEGAAVIVTQREAACGAWTDPTERGANRHADRLRSGIAVAALDDVPVQHFRVPVLDDAEQPDFA